MIALEVKEDGQIWLWPDRPVEPKRPTGWETKGGLKIEMGGDFGYTKAMEKYTEALASAERILISNQDVALDLLWRNDERIHNPVPFLYWKENMLKPGIYRIPDLKWEVKEHGSCGHPCDDYTDVCQHSGCTWERRKVAVIIQEDEKNGMYEESQEVAKALLSEHHFFNAYTPDRFEYECNPEGMKKTLREEVYKKYDGRCAYCGNSIDYKGMQVDHIWPKCANGCDTIDNLNPSCRRCNHYKRSHTLENFRLQMMTLHERIMSGYINKVGVDYKIVSITPFDGKFYFEKLNPQVK